MKVSVALYTNIRTTTLKTVVSEWLKMISIPNGEAVKYTPSGVQSEYYSFERATTRCKRSRVARYNK